MLWDFCCVPARMLPIEILESRIAPAGIITVSLEKGALTLVADDGDHEFSVTALDQWTFELKGTADTLFQMDGGTPTDTLVLTSPLKSLTATLGDGIDTVSLVGLSIGGDVKIDGGEGDNTLSLSTVSAKGKLQVTGGSGIDEIEVAGTLSVKKDFSLTLGDGDNRLVAVADNFQVGGQLSYAAGNGADDFSVAYGMMSVGKDLSLKFGSGSSTVNVATIAGFSVGKNLVVDTSDSLLDDSSTVTLMSLATRIGGDVRITDGAGSSSLMLTTAGSVGKINVVSGEGPANAMIGYLQLKSKAIEFDASESSESNLQVMGLGSTGTATAIKYTGGAGNDMLTALGIGGASVIAELGDGDNSAMLANIGGSVKAIKVTGGDGTDSVMLGVVTGSVANIDVQTGDGYDNVMVAVVNGSAKNIAIQSGTGSSQTGVVLANAKVSGKISVTNGDADEADFSIAALNAKIGSLEYTSEAATNMVSFGEGMVGFPGLPPIGEIPIDLEIGSPSGIQGLTVTKGIRVVTGDGEDTVGLSGATNVKVNKGIVLELGGGDNQVSGTVTNFVTKGLKVTGGDGADTVLLSGSGNLGAVALTLGAGANSATLGGDVVPLAIASLSYAFTSAADTTDGLMLARIISAGKVSAKFGAGESALRIEDSIIGGPFDVDTGAGDDLVEVDTANGYTGTVLTKAATIKLGDGDDTLTLGGNGTSSLLTAKATFSADGGAGTNTLTDGPDNIFAKTPKFLTFVS